MLLLLASPSEAYVRPAHSLGQRIDVFCAQVHNFNYPRTDPVVIMAIVSPDREQILLGRQVRALVPSTLKPH